jgi:hypothetical protein
MECWSCGSSYGRGRWYPEDETGQYRDVYAFAEQGHAPQSSGPLIRVLAGTQIRVSIHNSLPVAAKIFGLHRHPGDAKDALTLVPDERRQVQFVAGEAGTYLMGITVGETYDVEYRSDNAGMADMVVRDPIFYPPVTMRLQFVDAKAEAK